MKGTSSPVFSIIELLEHIILYCDFKTVFTIQLVAPMWRNVVAGSPSIQRKLFLLPILRNNNQKWLRWMSVEPPAGTTDPDLLSANFPVVTNKSSDTTPQQLIVQLNPLTTAYAKLKLHTKVKYMMAFEMDPQPLLLRQGGTWSNMFATQPPVKMLKMECCIRTHPKKHTKTYKATFRDENGVTLGQIMEKIHAHLRTLQSQTQFKVPAHMQFDDNHEALEKDLYTSFIRDLSFQLAMWTNHGYVSTRCCWVEEGCDNVDSDRLTEEMKKELF